jgi:ADP-ribosyl-[dinitrogen reductase] hydrolase
MRFLGTCGMVSDDTEHTLLVAQSLLAQPSDPESFQRSLAWKLRWWFAALPAGMGMATARACMKLWLGFPRRKSAVRSAGSGPAMRCAILGAFFAADTERRRDFVSLSSTLTHRSWQAEAAAQAVSECVALAVRNQGQPKVREVLELLRPLSGEQEWQDLLSRIEAGLSGRLSVAEFAAGLGLERGVTGYSLHVVPVAIYAWLRHPDDFRGTLIAALDCGGDTDTVGAVVGALAGVVVGSRGIPDPWVDSIHEWPRSVAFIRTLANRLSLQSNSTEVLGPVRYFWPGIFPRNLLFLCVVLLHGFRRLFPPY